MDICSSPQLFAAYHVLLRLLVPRHPPCALCNLTLVEIIRFAFLRVTHLNGILDNSLWFSLI